MPRRLKVLLLVLLLLPAAAAAGEVRRGRTSWSAALRRDIPYAVYLPDAYERVARRYPVLFLLHGLGGSEADWLDAGRLAPTLDRLTATGAVPPMIVVMPGMGDGWYVDGAGGAVQSAFLDDLVPAVDRAWRTRGTRDGRAVAGLSMGGWGALRFAMLRPRLFVAAASLSGAVVGEGRAADPRWAGLLASGFGSPVDVARLRAASPFALVDGFAATSLRPSLYLTCGDDDELGLDEDNQLLNLAMRRAGIDPEFRITDGGHDWALWAREIGPVLRFVAARFAKVGD